MNYLDNYHRWLESDAVDEDTKKELREIQGNPEEIESRFTSMLEFGTAGLRGVMQAGLNGMNVYTVRHATQAFANIIRNCGENIGDGVTIAHDCRNNSRAFACEAASVLMANGIHVNLFEDLRPTPELSFAIRETGSIAGINITASHNTKEFNGYKAYWADGAQMPPEHAEKVSQEMARIDIFDDIQLIDLEEAASGGLLTIIGAEMDEKYMSAVLAQSVGREFVAAAPDDFEIVFTPFHGAGYRLVPEVLRRIGMKHIISVPEQMVVDGNFPTVASPNPENVEGFKMAIALAKEKDSELIIGTDPDADRCGVVVRNGEEYQALTGNQIGVLLLDYLITVRKAKGILPENAAAVKSIVTTPMANRICEMNDVSIHEVFTGFKFIGEKIKEFRETGEYNFIFGFEESIGFLAGTYARDKDAVVASMLVAEMACYYRNRNMNLVQALQALYEKYGFYREHTTSVQYEGFDAGEKMRARMDRIREEVPTEIGLPVLRIRDYEKQEILDRATGERVSTGMEPSNVLYYELADRCNLAVRPSGTEPKIKIYVMAQGDSMEKAEANLRCIEDGIMEMLKREN